MDGAFFNSGQAQHGIVRGEEVYEPFLEQFLALTRQYVLGNPLELDNLGPVVRPQRAIEIQRKSRMHVDLARGLD